MDQSIVRVGIVDQPFRRPVDGAARKGVIPTGGMKGRTQTDRIRGLPIRGGRREGLLEDSQRRISLQNWCPDTNRPLRVLHATRSHRQSASYAPRKTRTQRVNRRRDLIPRSTQRIQPRRAVDRPRVGSPELSSPPEHVQIGTMVKTVGHRRIDGGKPCALQQTLAAVRATGAVVPRGMV